MKKQIYKKVLVSVIGAAMLAALFTGCSSGGSSSNVIKVGAIDPTTGDNANGGTDDLQGKEMAIEDFNKAGGLDIDGRNHTVELVSYDDASSASQSISVCTKLITEDKVAGIAGSFSSSCTLACLDALNEYNIPMITSGSSAASVLESGCDWISRAFPGDTLQISALLNYITEKHPETDTIGVIYSNDDYGIGGFGGVVSAAQSKGIKVVGESFGTDDTDMTAQLSNLKSQDIDCLFIWANYTPGSYCMKQARALDWDIQFYSGTGTIHDDTFALSDGAYIGTINSVPFTSAATDESTQDWISRYKEKYGETPSQNSARGYDAMMILLNAMKDANTTDSTAIQEAIRNTKDHAGVQGNISIDPATGEYLGDVQIVQAAEGDTWVFLDSASTESK
ncbi:MAG: ABC transporter substrate-binding protein [Anaerocolumna sp.]